MPPQDVKAYVKRNKNDTADAEAICEAVRRPSMRFVPVKTKEQQSALLMHRGRELLVRQRTMLANALRGHLAEFGLIAAQGLHNVAGLIVIVRNDEDDRVPDMARRVLRVIADGIVALDTQIAIIEAQIMAWHRTNAISQRLAAIPGIGPIIATAIAATVAEPGEFHSGRGEMDYLGEIASRWRFVMRRTVRLRRSPPTHKPRPSVRRGGAVADPGQARRATTTQQRF
jgi:transposase